MGSLTVISLFVVLLAVQVQPVDAFFGWLKSAAKWVGSKAVGAVKWAHGKVKSAVTTVKGFVSNVVPKVVSGFQKVVPVVQKMVTGVSHLSHGVMEGLEKLGVNVSGFKHKLKRFGKGAADILAKGLQIRNQYKQPEPPECERTICEGGAQPERLKNGLAADGCDTFGINIPPEWTPALAHCCNEHDECYADCAASRSKCDQGIAECMTKTCLTMSDAAAQTADTADDEEAEACTKVATLFTETVISSGCESFKKSQYEWCACPLQEGMQGYVKGHHRNLARLHYAPGQSYANEINRAWTGAVSGAARKHGGEFAGDLVEGMMNDRRKRRTKHHHGA